MARNDISFNTVGVPQLNLNASAFNSGLGAVNKGLEAFQQIGQKFQDTQQKNQQIQSEVDLSNLKKLADETLGGRLAGESLEDYDANLNEFLAQNGALTGNIGTKALNKFRNDFEQNLTAERNATEGRATTLEQKRRNDVAYERAEADFERSEARRNTLNNSRIAASGRLKAFNDTKARTLKQSGPLSTEDLLGLDLTTQVRQLEAELLAANPNMDPDDREKVLANFAKSADRTVLSTADKAKLARDKVEEERAYQERVGALKFQREAGKEFFKKALDQEPNYGAGDWLNAKTDFVDAVTKFNGDEGPPSDDVLQQYDELSQELLQQKDANGQPKWHAADVAKALAAATESADSILGFRFDEEIQNGNVGTLLQAAKDGRLHNKRKLAYGLSLTGTTITQDPTAGAAAPAQAQPDPDITPVLPQTVPAAAPTQTDDQVASLQADAAQTAPPVPAPTAQAEAAKAAELVPPLKAKSPDELKAVAINQLTKTEAPKVEANLEAALKKVPRGAAATSADDILRGELIAKLGNLRNYIDRLKTPQSKADTRAAAAERAAATQNLF